MSFAEKEVITAVYALLAAMAVKKQKLIYPH